MTAEPPTDALIQTPESPKHRDKLCRGLLLAIFVIGVSNVLLSSCVTPVRQPMTFHGHNMPRAMPLSSPQKTSVPAILQHRLEGQELRILCWNVHKEVSDEPWQRDFQSLLTKTQANLIVLQEALYNRQLTGFLKELYSQQNTALHWDFAPQLYDPRADSYSGVMTLAPAASKSRKAVLSNGLEPVIGTPKVSLLTTYRLPLLKTQSRRESLLVINIHAINFKITLQDFKEQLRALADLVTTHHGPVIFAGDFNTWRSARQQHLDQIADELKLKKVDFGDGVKAVFGNPLDHIYYSANAFDFIEGSAKVLSADEVKSSDHRPLLVTLRFKSR